MHLALTKGLIKRFFHCTTREMTPDKSPRAVGGAAIRVFSAGIGEITACNVLLQIVAPLLRVWRFTREHDAEKQGRNGKCLISLRAQEA